jgi:hypothetical protein
VYLQIVEQVKYAAASGSLDPWLIAGKAFSLSKTGQSMQLE